MTLHVGATNATVQQPQLIVGYIVDAPHYLHPLLITRRAMLLPRAQVRQYGVGAHYDWKYAHLQHSAIRRSKQDVRSLQNCEWHVSCTAPRTQRTVSARNSRSEGHEAATDSGSSVQQAFDFDVFVIGGGSGGVRAAKIAANGGEGLVT